MEYEPVIGVEIHVELNTKSKMFSSSPCSFGMMANSQTVGYDLAFPGVMPVVNKQAVRYAIKVCKALNMEIAKTLYFDRKNYFYPDLPKGYQITQQFQPIGKNGYVEIETEDGKIKISVDNAHLEEDTAKQLHLANESLVDFNRCGTPLLEIVSNPDIHSGLQAQKYVEAIREIVTYLDVSDGKMENGSLRCDINVSLKKVGSKKLGVKTECKNLNSIQHIKNAVDYEVKRQTEILNRGEKVVQQTRRWDETLKQTVLMREKTTAIDYKYYREPNIVPIDLDDSFIEDAILDMNKLPTYYREQLKEYNLTSYQIEELLANKELLLYFEECLNLNCKNPQLLCNLLLSDILGYLNNNSLVDANRRKIEMTLKDLKFNNEKLISLVNLFSDNKINSKQCKDILNIMFETGEDPISIAERENFVQNSDESFISSIVSKIIESNAQSVTDWQNGKDKVLGFLVGQVMKESKGKANPNIAKDMILKIIGPCGEYKKKV